MPTPEQCRAARAMVGWSRKQLAGASKVAVRTVADFERRARQPRKVTVEALQRALEAAGIMFIDGGGHGPGVRLRGPLPVSGHDHPVGRPGDAVRVVLAAAELAGGVDEAVIWFENEPIVGHGGRTAAGLVADGHAEAVLAFIRDLAGGAKG